MAIRVLIADDHPALIRGVRAVLESAGGITVAGEAHSPGALIELLRDVECDILVMDYLMTHDDHRGERDGLYLLRAVRRSYPALPIVIFTMLTGAGFAETVLKLGANAILCKRDPIDALPKMLGLVLGGDLVVRSPMGATPRDTVAAVRRRSRRLDCEKGPFRKLSMREVEVVRLLTRGHSLQEVALFVNRSAKTISNQKRSAMHKLGLSNDMALARFVLDMEGSEGGVRDKSGLPLQPL